MQQLACVIWIRAKMFSAKSRLIGGFEGILRFQDTVKFGLLCKKEHITS